MADKIAIIVTTMFRDEMLEKAVVSMKKYLPPNTIILIGDQGHKEINVSKITKYENMNCYYYVLPYDCGLSAARNYLVEQAQNQGCEYCIIASDSMIFTERTKNIGDLIYDLNNGYDAIGCHLNGGVPIYWVGWIKLIPGLAFELDFINRNILAETEPFILDCSIIHNFFIAKTSTLVAVKWDNNLKLAEHEDFFWRYNQAGYKVGWTGDVSCDYVRSRTGIAEARQRNWHDGLQKLYKKWGINHWIEYKNRENGFFGIQK
jgi:hypothetical protein